MSTSKSASASAAVTPSSTSAIPPSASWADHQGHDRGMAVLGEPVAVRCVRIAHGLCRRRSPRSRPAARRRSPGTPGCPSRAALSRRSRHRRRGRPRRSCHRPPARPASTPGWSSRSPSEVNADPIRPPMANTDAARINPHAGRRLATGARPPSGPASARRRCRAGARGGPCPVGAMCARRVPLDRWVGGAGVQGCGGATSPRSASPARGRRAAAGAAR